MPVKQLCSEGVFPLPNPLGLYSSNHQLLPAPGEPGREVAFLGSIWGGCSRTGMKPMPVPSLFVWLLLSKHLGGNHRSPGRAKLFCLSGLTWWIVKQKRLKTT